jgi:hypothetical protein
MVVDPAIPEDKAHPARKATQANLVLLANPVARGTPVAQEVPERTAATARARIVDEPKRRPTTEKSLPRAGKTPGRVPGQQATGVRTATCSAQSY